MEWGYGMLANAASGSGCGEQRRFAAPIKYQRLHRDIRPNS